ncbi:MAG: hydrogenase maturation protease [Actinobacteria bacterium]|nr:hydrogenase maturation protease [Actinomycetota bacterium]
MLCLGNPLVADDAVGPAVAAELRSRLSDAEVVESSLAGLGLLDDLLDVDRLVVVDAVATGRAPAGATHVWAEDDIDASPGGWQHSLGLFEMLGLARALGLHAPRDVVLVGVEAGDLTNVGGPMTPPVGAAVPAVVGVVERLVADPA